jgi:hypothetical protein
MRACREKKLALSGETEIYRCELVSLRSDRGVLRYIIDREYDVAGFRLSPGDETLAFYWPDRPYTLYVWFRKRQGDRAYYFNIADAVALRPDEFLWRDLAVDILVDENGTVRVLDEHELPHDLPSGLLDYIMKAKDHILAHFGDILEEAEKLIADKT